ncbi:MAG: alpha-beta hydrolase superfamily lysophospholipase, partial [Psychrobacter glaciei]
RNIVSRLKKQNFNNVSVKLYPNMRHEPLHEQANKVVYHDILEWIDDNSSTV